MTLKAASICIGVTATPWPIGMDPIDVPDQSSGSSIRPPDSFGKSSPVREPNPKRRRYSSIRSRPRPWASWIVPMFDDVARMSVGVHDATGCGSWSVKVWSETCRWSGTWRWSVGVTTPSSRAADNVMTLLTEPGSNTAVRARFSELGAAGPPSGGTTTLAMA